jgi:superfamily II DNA or RNA helicase
LQCGPIRHKVDAKEESEKRPFDHFVMPRFTRYLAPLEKELSIQELYADLCVNELRNRLIADDVIAGFQSGGNALVLTERTAHVELLADKVREKVPDVITLVGNVSAREKKEVLDRIAGVAAGAQLTLIATGRYIGEGFDESRLDTLFLAMPIAWKGTLHQYAGRLHRLCENKREVRIYDYVDIDVRVLEKMYQKRLSGYAAIGYKVSAAQSQGDSIGIIFDRRNFLRVFDADVMSANREIIIVSPYVTSRRARQMLMALNPALEKKLTWRS